MPVSRENGRAIFSVSDTGIGIGREDHERIFREFGQIESPVQRKVRGTGLGLPLSKKLAELIGGTLTVESEPGMNSIFRLDLPFVFRTSEASAGNGQSKQVPVGQLPAAKDDAPGSILIIDDEEIARYFGPPTLPGNALSDDRSYGWNRRAGTGAVRPAAPCLIRYQHAGPKRF